MMRELEAGKAVGAQKGLVETINEMIKIFQCIRGGFGIEIHKDGTNWVIDSTVNRGADDGEEVPPEGGGGGGGVAVPPYSDPASCWRFTPNGTSGTVTNCHFFLGKDRTVSNFSVGVGTYYLRFIRAADGSFKDFSTATSDDSNVDNVKSYTEEQIFCFPIYTFGIVGGALTVTTDYIHSCPNIQSIQFPAVFGTKSSTFTTSPGYDPVGLKFNFSKRTDAEFWTPVVDGDGGKFPKEMLEEYLQVEAYDV